MREDAMIKAFLMIPAFTLIFMVSASAQDGMRRDDQRFMGQQQRRDRYEQQRRRERVGDERRDNTILGDQWRTENWCDARGVLFLCRDRYEQQRRRERVRDERRDNTILGDQPLWRTENWCDARGVLFLCRQ
jgi:hypothetical protein